MAARGGYRVTQDCEQALVDTAFKIGCSEISLQENGISFSLKSFFHGFVPCSVP